MLKRLLGAAIFIVFGAAFAQADAHRIGAIASLTGPAGEQGQNWLKGAQLAAEELKTQGVTVDLRVEDDASTPAKVVSAFHKLLEVDKVQALIGGTWDFLAEAGYPLAKQYRVPFITPTNPPEILSEPALKNPWIFTNGLPIASEAAAAFEFFRTIKPVSVGIAYSDVPFGSVHAQMIRSLALEAGAKIAFDYPYPPESYLEAPKTIALKAAKARPDLVFVLTNYEGLDLLTSEFARLRLSPRILTTQHLDQAFQLSKERSRYDRCFGIYPVSILDESFRARFSARYREEPKVYAAEGFDALMFLARALEAKIDLSLPQAVFEYKGVSGVHRLPAISRGISSVSAVIMSTEGGTFHPYTVSGGKPG